VGGTNALAKFGNLEGECVSKPIDEVASRPGRAPSCIKP